MVVRTFLLALALAMLAPSQAEAQAPPGPITLEEVLRSIDVRHPLLDAARVERDVAAGDLQSAEGAFDVAWRTRGTVVPLGGYPSGRIDTLIEVPTPWWGLTLFSGYRWGSDSFAPYDEKLETNEIGEVRVGAALPFWRNGPIDRRRANIERAELGRPLAELTVAEREIELTRVASLRYWDWVGAGKRLRIAKEALEVAIDRDADVAARAASGDIPAIEKTENARAILQRRQQVIAAQRALVASAFELSLYYRDGEGEPIRPPEGRLPQDLPAPNKARPLGSAAVAESIGRRPEMARLGYLRAQGAVEREWAGNQRAPAIDLTVVGSQDLGEGDPKRRPFELEISLFIDVPIETNVAEGRVKAADAQLARVEAQAAFAADQIAAQVLDASAAVDLAFERFEVAREELRVAHELEVGEREKFRLGDSTLLIVNLREQATLDAAIREVDAAVDYHKARASLDAVMAERRDGTGRAPRRRR